MASPRKMVRDSIGFALAQFVVRAVMIVRTVLAARWLGPAPMGAWNAIQLLMDYGMLAPFGTQHGLDQLVPRRIVDADPVALARVKRAGFTSIVLLSLLFGAVCVVYFENTNGNVLRSWGWTGVLLALGVILLINVANYHTTLLRSHGSIGAVSRWFFVQGMIGGVGGLLLARRIGIWGLLDGWAAGTLVSFLWTRWDARRIAPWTPLVAAETRDLIRVGFPMYFFVGSSSIIRNLDRLVILKYLGTQSLGYYGLAVTAFTLMMYLPDSATFVFYPRLLQRFRASGDRPELVQEPVVTLLRLITVITPALGGLVALLTRDLIEVALPKFAPGIPAIQVMSFTATGLAMSNFASVVLMTLGRQMVLIPIAIGSVIAFVSADLMVLHAGHGITGVAWATLSTYAVSGSVVLALALVALGFDGRRIFRHIALALSGLAVALVLAALCDRFVPWGGGGNGLRRLLHASLASATFLLVYFVTMSPQLRGLGMLNLVSEFNPVLAGWLRRGLSMFRGNGG